MSQGPMSHTRTETATSQLTLSPTSSIPLPPHPLNVIPAEHPHRTLVVCFDGTGNEFDSDNSNVVEFFSMLKKDDRSQQVVYYQPGIGTYLGRRGTSGSLKTKVAELWDEAVAWNLSDHVKEGYNFLMQNYINGDRISIFGFSRGAYTARALAGMLHKVGLLTPGNEEQIPFAYKMFARTDKQSWDAACQFKDAFAIDVKVDFLGVWDTVRSVGLLDRSLPFSTSNNHIRAFRHAISLDERRTKFLANHWNPPSAEEASLGSQYDEENTDVKEVWFSGGHGDIGGGSVNNKAKHALARITLRWMLQECFRCNTGIMFDTTKIFAKTGFTSLHLQGPALQSRIYSDPDHFEKDQVSGSSPKDVEVYKREKEDVKCHVDDELNGVTPWWILECLPLHRSLVSNFVRDKPMGRFRRFLLQHPINLGKGRMIPRYDSEGVKRSIYVHHTVHRRIAEKEYVPAARNWKDIEPHVAWTD